MYSFIHAFNIHFVIGDSVYLQSVSNIVLLILRSHALLDSVSILLRLVFQLILYFDSLSTLS